MYAYVNCVCDLLRLSVAAALVFVVVRDAVADDGNVVRQRDVELVLPAAHEAVKILLLLFC